MAKKIIAFSIIFICTIIITIPLQSAGLSDFKDKVEKEERENREEEHHSSDAGNGCLDAGCAALGSIFSNDNPVSQERDEQASTEPGSTDRYYAAPPSGKTESPAKPTGKKKKYDNRHLFSIEAGALWDRQYGWGFSTGARLLFFNFIGLDFDMRSIWENESSHLDYYGAGLVLSYAFVDTIVPSLYLHYAAYRSIIERDGAALGLMVNIYPVKPLSLMFKVGGQFFEQIDFADLEARLGVLVRFFEVWAGYRFISAKYAHLDGPIFGVRFVF